MRIQTTPPGTPALGGSPPRGNQGAPVPEQSPAEESPESSPPQPPAPPDPPDPPRAGDPGAWWNRIGIGDFLEHRLHLPPESIDAGVDGMRDVGKSIAVSWPNLKETVEKILGHPLLDNHIPDSGQARLECAAIKVAGGLGYAVVGMEGVVGVAKLIQGFRDKNGLQKLDGFLDLTAGAAILSTLVGVGTWPLVLGPIAAGLGVARGAGRAVRAYQAADAGKEVQSFLDATRSAKVMCSLLGYKMAMFSTVGAILGPVAAGVQACRGYVELRSGLKKSDKPLQVEGLADIATATGLGLCFSGLVVPGVAVTVATFGAHLLYKTCPKFEKAVDGVLNRTEKPIRNVVAGLEHLVNPVFKRIRRWIDTHSPWQHGEDKDKTKPPK